MKPKTEKHVEKVVYHNKIPYEMRLSKGQHVFFLGPFLLAIGNNRLQLGLFF